MHSVTGFAHSNNLKNAKQKNKNKAKEKCAWNLAKIKREQQKRERKTRKNCRAFCVNKL